MHILLPPSEAKAAGGTGTPLQRRLRSSPLDEPRAELAAALAELLTRPDAAQRLLLPETVAAAALRANAAIGSSPTLPALRRYTGVVFQGLDEASLSEPARRAARRAVLIFSGLFGVLTGGEPVPAYRVPAKTNLPDLGIAGTWWRPRLGLLLPQLLGRGPIVDLRSTDYAAMYQPDQNSPLAARWLAVTVLSRTPQGLSVISYPSKLGKGKLAAALLERHAGGRPVHTADDVLHAWQLAGGHDGAERTVAGRHRLELVI